MLAKMKEIQLQKATLEYVDMIASEISSADILPAPDVDGTHPYVAGQESHT